jgi:hypothetical protein
VAVADHTLTYLVVEADPKVAALLAVVAVANHTAAVEHLVVDTVAVAVNRAAVAAMAAVDKVAAVVITNHS